MLYKNVWSVLIAVLVAAGLAGCSGEVSSQPTGADPSAQLVSISLTPTNSDVAINTSNQLTATGIYSDNSTRDLTRSVAWSSSDETVATVDSQGLVSCISIGTATIDAVSPGLGAAAGGIHGRSTITVSNAKLVSIAITPVNPSIAKGTTRQFTATGTFSNNTTQDLTAQASWSSSSTGVATISNAAGSRGLATAVDTGSTTITAAFESVSATDTLTVSPSILMSLAVTPVNPSIAKGTTLQFTATGTFSDSTTQDLTAQAVWDTSNAGAASISNAAGSKGLAAAVAAGSATITATAGGISGSTTLTITPATLVSITVTPGNPSIAKGTTQQFTATGAYSDGSTQDLTAQTTWSSSNTGAASISNAAGSKGLAAAIAAGATTITAASGNVAGNAAMTVLASSQATLSWNAPTTYSDGTYLDPASALAKYRIYYGPSSRTYTQTVDVVNPGTTTLTYTLNLAPGTYYFAVTAIDTTGQESGYSTEGMKTM